MTNTKRALFLSIVYMFLCIVMLASTTFAWFTDSVESTNNIIKTGTLKVDLLNDSVSLKETPTHKIFDYQLWEPGYTQTEGLTLVNYGDLHFKYQLRIIPSGAPTALANVIDVYVEDAVTGRDTLTNKIGTLASVLSAGGVVISGNTSELTLSNGLEVFDKVVVLKMQESAGNDYQDMNLVEGTEGFSVRLDATQLTKEEDSFDDQYDKFADYDGEISSADALVAAFANGGTYKLIADITLEETLTVPAGNTVNLDLGGKTISSPATAIINEGTMTIANGKIENTTVNGDAVINNKGSMVLDSTSISGAPIGDSSSSYPAYAVRSSGNLVIEEGTIITSDRGALSLSGTGETVINGGTFASNDVNITGGYTSHVILVSYGAANQLTINGGNFEHRYAETSGGVVVNNWSATTVKVNGGNFSGGNYFGKWDNLSDYGYGMTSKPFSVTGGTFTGLDTKYVADGYVVTDNGDGTWTVGVKQNNTYTINDVEVSLSEESYDSITYHTNANYSDKIHAIEVYNKKDLLSAVKLIKEGVMVHNGQNDIPGEVIFMADIDFEGDVYSGFGKGFNVIGNGHTLSNIKFIAGDDGKAGFIAYAGNNVISDLTIADATVEGAQAGVFAGNASKVTLDNCALEGDIKVTFVASAVEEYNGVAAVFGVSAEGASTIDVDVTNANITIDRTGITYPGNYTPDGDVVGVVYGGSYTIA